MYRPAVTRTERLIRFLTAGAATISSPAELSESEQVLASGVSSCSSNRPFPTLNVERNPRLNVPVSKSVCLVNRWPGAGFGTRGVVDAGGVAAAGDACIEQPQPAERGDGIDPPVGDAHHRPGGHAQRRDDLTPGEARIP